MGGPLFFPPIFFRFMHFFKKMLYLCTSYEVSEEADDSALTFEIGKISSDTYKAQGQLQNGLLAVCMWVFADA